MMNSRERFLAAINHEKVDRVPTDLCATDEVWKKLREHFGGDSEVMEALHIDGSAHVDAKYVGPTLTGAPEGGYTDFWSIQYEPVSHGTGVYFEQCYWPLADARTIDDLEKHQWPSTDWFDYSEMRAAAEAAHDKQTVTCGYMAPFYYHNLLRELEKSLIDPYDDPDFTHRLVDRVSEFFYEHHLRMFQACEGLIDFAEVTDDFGGQTGLLISPPVFQEFYKPHMQRMIDLCHQFGIKAFHHDDGAIRPLIPDLIEMGIDILDPIQWRCSGMEIEGLKADFGKLICFHGGVDNQETLPFGTPDEVRAEVRWLIDVLSSDQTGYILAPCHCIQSNTPIENIIAMYDEAKNYGRYEHI